MYVGPFKDMYYFIYPTKWFQLVIPSIDIENSNNKWANAL